MAFDFPTAELPQLLPLDASHEENEVEAELKRLTQHLWAKHLAASEFDTNVLGMAHLGSLDLVRRSVNQDGLVLMPGAGEEAATRYLYRAWKAANHQGRGLHFVKTYLQLLFPNVAKVEQLWMDPEGSYPQDVYSVIPADDYFMPHISEQYVVSVDGSWNVGEMIEVNKEGENAPWLYNTEGLILTSRVRITLDFSVDISGFGNLLQILRSVMPARLVPVFHFAITAEAPVPVVSESLLDVRIGSTSVANPEFLIITDDPGWSWNLGAESDPDSSVPHLWSCGTEAALWTL